MKPRFYSNTDNNHCLQCCVRMILNTVTTEGITASVVNEETDFDPSLWTWTIAGAPVLSQRLKDIKIINEEFDYKRFADNKAAYLKEIWTNAKYISQSSYASKDFKKEVKLSLKFLNTGGIVEYMEFSERKIDILLETNFIIAQIDHSKLYNLTGNSSHYILIYDQLGDALKIHDPGLPPRQNHVVNKSKFLTAFTQELITIPKPDWWFPQNKIGRNDPCPCASGKKNKKCHDIQG